MTKHTYRSSGVDVDKANRFVKSIQSLVQSTMDDAVLKRSGSFGALYELTKKNVKDPVLVSSTDGVGTKLLIAQLADVHQYVGIDLVAMNVNDILCCGARPLFFLDYIACGALDPKVLKKVVAGIAKGCQLSGCSLIGGETAEMPGMYDPQEYDLAGFAVGIVARKKLIDGSKIKAGDQLFALPSSGFHSNGYSLVRKVYGDAGVKQRARQLLKPTRIYTNEVLSVLDDGIKIKGMAHITGGAFYDKLTKVLPDGLAFHIDCSAWRVPRLFLDLQKAGHIDTEEMFKTFNMGLGFAVVVSSKMADQLAIFWKNQGTKFYKIGEVVKNDDTNLIMSH